MVAVPKQSGAFRTRKNRNGAPSAAGWTTHHLDLSFAAGDLAAVRTAVASHALALGLEPERRDDAVLVVHELCGNAVTHGGGAGRLVVWSEPRRLICQVSDSGPGMAEGALTGTDLPPARTCGGRGLWIARRLAAVRISTGPTGTTVTAELSLG